MFLVSIKSDSEINKKLAQNIKARRQTLGLSQSQTANLMGISQQALAGYELGQRRIPAGILPAFSDTLQTTPEELLGLERKTKRGRLSQIEKRIDSIRQLPTKDQQYIIETIDRVIASNTQKAS